MILQGLRLMLLVGLVISAVTANGVVTAPTMALRHHQPTPCEPDC